MGSGVNGVQSCGVNPLSICYNGADLVAAGGDGSYTWSVCDSIPTSGSCTSYTVVDTDSLYTTSSTSDEIKLEDGSGGVIFLNSGVSGVPNCITGVVSVTDNHELLVFPNPTNGNVTFILNHSLEGELELYDCVGNIVKKVSISSRGTVISLLGVESGIYLYNCYLKNNKIIRGKLILQ